MNQYEAMFLFDPTFGSSFENCEAEVRRIMGRAEAEVLFCRKWEERRLAYRVNGRKRGVYVLVYFNSAGDKLKSIERDVKLSEDVLRIMVLRADGVTPEMMERALRWRGEEEVPDRESEGRPDRRPDRRPEGTPENKVESKPEGAPASKPEGTAERVPDEIATIQVAEPKVAEPKVAEAKVAEPKVGDGAVVTADDDLEDTAEMIVEPVEVPATGDEKGNDDVVSETDSTRSD